MFDKITPDVIASAITGAVFVLSGLGLYLRTRGGPKLSEGAYKIESPAVDAAKQLERVAQALEDIAAQGKDSFQREMREKLAKLDEIDEALDRLKDERDQGRRR